HHHRLRHRRRHQEDREASEYLPIRRRCEPGSSPLLTPNTRLATPRRPQQSFTIADLMLAGTQEQPDAHHARAHTAHDPPSVKQDNPPDVGTYCRAQQRRVRSSSSSTGNNQDNPWEPLLELINNARTVVTYGFPGV